MNQVYSMLLISSFSCFKFSPTSAAGKGSKFEVLSNVKGQMSSWIGSVQVPSVPNIFNKGGDASNPEATGETKVDSPTSGESVKGSPEQNKDEDDNSRYRYISLLCVLAQYHGATILLVVFLIPFINNPMTVH